MLIQLARCSAAEGGHSDIVQMWSQSCHDRPYLVCLQFARFLYLHENSPKGWSYLGSGASPRPIQTSVLQHNNKKRHRSQIMHVSLLPRVVQALYSLHRRHVLCAAQYLHCKVAVVFPNQICNFKIISPYKRKVRIQPELRQEPQFLIILIYFLGDEKSTRKYHKG